MTRRDRIFLVGFLVLVWGVRWAVSYYGGAFDIATTTYP